MIKDKFEILIDLKKLLLKANFSSAVYNIRSLMLTILMLN